MTQHKKPHASPPSVTDGGLAVVYCAEAFSFNGGHPMRGSRCLICAQPVGGDLVTVIGVAALAGEACDCSRIVSDVFLLHAAHLPMDPPVLQVAIQLGMTCKRDHL